MAYEHIPPIKTHLYGEPNTTWKLQITKCIFDIGWHGPCGKPAGGKAYCKEHIGERCVSCRKPAVRSCSHLTAFVCGASLCDDCKHGNVYSGGHERKRL